MRASQSIAGTCAVRSVSTDALGRVASRYRHRYQGMDPYPDLLLPWLLPEMDRRGEGKSTLATSSSDPASRSTGTAVFDHILLLRRCDRN